MSRNKVFFARDTMVRNVSTYIVSAIPENDGGRRSIFLRQSSLPPRKDLSLDWIYAVCTLYFSAAGEGRVDIRPKRKEMKKKSRDRGDNNVRSDRKDARHTHAHQLSWSSPRYAPRLPPLLARFLPFVDPPIYPATHSLPVRPPASNPWRPSVTRISNMILR